jgi:hypothetical protein
MASPTYAITNKYPRQVSAMTRGKNDESTAPISLNTQSHMSVPKYLIYIYNILNLQHVRTQPPLFPKFVIPACLPGKEFAYSTAPPEVLMTYDIYGTIFKRYEYMDGRCAAMSLVNPSAFPGVEWKNQVADWSSIETATTGDGDNLNKIGVFWSLTRPDEIERLRGEIKIFRDIANKTMNDLIREGEMMAASNNLKGIGPLHHFAMDYTGKQAHWHMPTFHMIMCPNCGESVREGLAFHKNSFGDRCIIDPDRYKEFLKQRKAAQLLEQQMASDVAVEEVEVLPAVEETAAVEENDNDAIVNEALEEAGGKKKKVSPRKKR